MSLDIIYILIFFERLKIIAKNICNYKFIVLIEKKIILYHEQQ